MLGWLLLGALLTAAVISITVYYLDKDTAKQELKSKNIQKSVVKDIVKNDNVAHVKLDAITVDGDEVEVDIQTDTYDPSEIYEGLVIYTEGGK